MTQKAKFKGDVVVKWRKDGITMKLVQDFSFRDSKGTHWKAPAGSIVNGAGNPFNVLRGHAGRSYPKDQGKTDNVPDRDALGSRW